jgi:hypothetical protein
MGHEVNMPWVVSVSNKPEHKITHVSESQTESKVPITDLTSVQEAQGEEESRPSTTVQEASEVWITPQIRNVLEREVRLKTSEWSSQDVVVPLHTPFEAYENNIKFYKDEFLFPEAIFQKSSQVVDKINNYQYMKADVELTIRVNATRFMVGCLMAVYTPFSYATSRFRSEANENLPSLSTFPHVKLDVKNSSTATIKIPFASVYDSYNLSDSLNAFGAIRIYVLSPLADAASSTRCTYTVTAKLQNIELAVPTSRSGPSRVLDEKQPIRAKAHGGKEKTQGPVTRISSGIADVAAAVATTGIPNLTIGALVVGWVARAVAGIAQIFGWSKPNIDATPSPMFNAPARGMMHGEGPEESQALAMIQDNKICSMNVTPETRDEMALGYIFERPNIFDRKIITLAESQPDALVYSHPVSPAQPSYTDSSTLTQICCGAMYYATALHRFWRGELEFTYHIVRSEFHSGRLIAVFFPETALVDVPKTLTQEMTNNINTIYQLEEADNAGTGDEFVFTVPYQSNQPWKLTLSLLDGAPDMYSLKTSTGSVGIYCFTEIIAPETLAQQYTIIPSVRGTRSYEVAKPDLQLMAGFGSAPTPADPSDVLATYLNTMWNDGTFETFIQEGNYALREKLINGGLTRWAVDPNSSQTYLPGVIEQPYVAPNGTYAASVTITFSNSGIVAPNIFDFTISVVDNVIQSALSDQQITSAIEGVESTWTVVSNSTSSSVKTEVTSEQIIDVTEGSETTKAIEPQTSSATVIAEAHGGPEMEASTVNEVRKSTVGEYNLSLRTLMKRFSKVLSIGPDAFLSYTPMGLANSTSTDASLAGRRTMEFQENTLGAYIPETMFSAISYLYRFYSGGTNLKVNLPWQTLSEVTMDATTDLRATQVKSLAPPSGFFQNGILNNSLAVNLPFYNSLRAGVVGGSGFGETIRAAFSLKQNPIPGDLYEAAGDDFSFFFLVGPPPMIPARNSPQVPVISAVTRGLQTYK